MSQKRTTRRRPAVRAAVVSLFAAALAGAFAVAAFGGDSGARSAKVGGTITALISSDVDYIDPGASYYSFGYTVHYATQRPLYAYKPSSVQPFPDFAASMPVISNGGTTVTVKLRHGVKFSPPVNREATSADVKYAIERAFSTSVANGYVGAYFGVVKGTPAKSTRSVPSISGIQTPDKYTVVFQLKRPSGTFAGALGMPVTAPVPREYATQYDKLTTSTYGQHQVATGPYMIENDSAGNLTGYEPQRLIKLVRNPNWDAKTSWRPAYADEVLFKGGYTDPTIITKEILSGTADVNADTPVPPAQLKQILANPAQKKQLTFTPTGGSRYVALNTTKKPFDNVNVRRAVAYVLDRNAMRLTRGGAIDGKIATHFIDPSFKGAGWEASGGYGFNPFPTPGFRGSVAKAKAEMKKAGYSTGMYTGPAVSMVVSSTMPHPNTAKVVIASLAKIGIKVKPVYVTHSAMYTRFCNVPRQEPAICPSVGWLPDFHEPETLLDATFNGKNIVPVNNSNWPQLNDPAINAAMDKAERIMDPETRFKAWGKIDQMVTRTAAAVPWLWEDYPVLYSTRVTHAPELWNQGAPDVTFMQVKG